MSRGTGGVRSASSAADGEKKKPGDPAAVPMPPGVGAPTSGAAGAGDRRGADRSFEAGVRARTVVAACAEPAGRRRGVTTGDSVVGAAAAPAPAGVERPAAPVLDGATVVVGCALVIGGVATWGALNGSTGRVDSVATVDWLAAPDVELGVLSRDADRLAPRV